MYPFLESALKDFRKKNFIDFGRQIGIASDQILVGESLIREQGVNPRINDPGMAFY